MAILTVRMFMDIYLLIFEYIMDIEVLYLCSILVLSVSWIGYWDRGSKYVSIRCPTFVCYYRVMTLF
jgi:hypothetical protein